MFERENRTVRFYDFTDGPDGVLRVGIKKALDYAQEHEHEVVVVVVQTLDGAADLIGVLGASRARKLRQGAQVQLGEVALCLATKRNLSVGADTPAVVVWAHDDILVELDDRQPPAIIAVASSEGRMPEWLADWRPQPLREATSPLPPAIPNLSPVLEAAMRGMTLQINCGTGLGNSRDKELAVGILRAFEDANEPYEPVALRVWAANHGWTAAGARQLAEVAGEVQAGVRHRSVRKMPADLVGRYRQAAVDF